MKFRDIVSKVQGNEEVKKELIGWFEKDIKKLLGVYAFVLFFGLGLGFVVGWFH